MKIRIGRWYWAVLLLWMITGFPVAIIGFGFAGTDIFSLEGIVAFFTPDLQSVRGFVTWLIAFVIVFLPLLALPLALKRKNRDSADAIPS